MAQLDVNINGRSYRVACDDGQEDHLRQLAEYVDRQVMELVGSVGQVGEARLLVMACLLIADDLSESFATSQGKSDAEAGCTRGTAALKWQVPGEFHFENPRVNRRCPRTCVSDNAIHCL